MKEYMIDDIQAMTEAEAAAIALETLDVKGHTIYLVSGVQERTSHLLCERLRVASQVEKSDTGAVAGGVFAEDAGHSLYTEGDCRSPIGLYRLPSP